MALIRVQCRQAVAGGLADGIGLQTVGVLDLSYATTASVTVEFAPVLWAGVVKNTQYTIIVYQTLLPPSDGTDVTAALTYTLANIRDLDLTLSSVSFTHDAVAKKIFATFN